MMLHEDSTVRFWRTLIAQVKEKIPVTCDADMGAEMVIHNIFFFALKGLTNNDQNVEVNKESIIHFIIRGLGLTPP
jgi:hypothetical protein